MNYYHKVRRQSALIFVLKGLIPYSRENMLLAFKPNAFFNELEKISRYKRRSLENALREAERAKLIEKQTLQAGTVVRLTTAGKKILRPFVAKRLSKQAKLMVIFDIPEELSGLRARFRRVLRHWHFVQVQKSVWLTTYDHQQSVKELVAELELQPYVEIYECEPIS